MRKSNLSKLVFGALLLLLGVAVWYILKPDPISTGTASRIPTSETAPGQAPSELNLSTSRPGPDLAIPADRPMPTAPSPTEDGIPVWERKIDAALRSQGEHSAIALGLLSEVNSMPAEGQTAAAQRLKATARTIGACKRGACSRYRRPARIAPGMSSLRRGAATGVGATRE